MWSMQYVFRPRPTFCIVVAWVREFYFDFVIFWFQFYFILYSISSAGFQAAICFLVRNASQEFNSTRGLANIAQLGLVLRRGKKLWCRCATILHARTDLDLDSTSSVRATGLTWTAWGMRQAKNSAFLCKVSSSPTILLQWKVLWHNQLQHLDWATFSTLHHSSCTLYEQMQNGEDHILLTVLMQSFESSLEIVLGLHKTDEKLQGRIFLTSKHLTYSGYEPAISPNLSWNI